jgi:hypothetical protein
MVSHDVEESSDNGAEDESSTSSVTVEDVDSDTDDDDAEAADRVTEEEYVVVI